LLGSHGKVKKLSKKFDNDSRKIMRGKIKLNDIGGLPCCPAF
jgi:hypothetical protein